jgi:hypothetical protein
MTNLNIALVACSPKWLYRSKSSKNRQFKANSRKGYAKEKTRLIFALLI